MYAITKTLKKQQIYTGAKVIQITRIITNNIHLLDPYIPSTNRVILRILPMQATLEINRITQTAQKRTKIVHILLHQIAREIFETIWKLCCTMIASSSSNPLRRPDKEAVEDDTTTELHSTSKALAQLHNAQLSERINSTKIDK
ncbi:15497_t:CDS:1, partial [Gigaspora rosea]